MKNPTSKKKASRVLKRETYVDVKVYFGASNVSLLTLPASLSRPEIKKELKSRFRTITKAELEFPSEANDEFVPVEVMTFSNKLRKTSTAA